MRSFYLLHPGLAELTQSTLVVDRDQVEGARADLVRAQIEALVRLGVPATLARELFEATVFWSLAAVAAERPDGPDDERAREDRYRSGLAMLTDGLRSALHRAVR